MFETLSCGYQSKHTCKPDSRASQTKSHTSKWRKKKCTFAIAEQKEAMKDVFWRRGDRVDFKMQKYLT